MFFAEKPPTAGRLSSTMCIIHKGFRGFQALSPALILGVKLIGLSPQSLTKSYTNRIDQNCAQLTSSFSRIESTVRIVFTSLSENNFFIVHSLLLIIYEPRTICPDIFSGSSTKLINKAKFPDEYPVIKFIVFSGASHWKLDSLTISSEGIRVRFDPPLEHPVYPIKDNSLIHIIDNSSNITVENCFIASVNNSSEWTKDDWNYKYWNGIYNTKNSDITIRNCHLKNINFGIQNTSSCVNHLYENNIIENFSGDALRGNGTNNYTFYKFQLSIFCRLMA